MSVQYYYAVKLIEHQVKKILSGICISCILLGGNYSDAHGWGCQRQTDEIMYFSTQLAFWHSEVKYWDNWDNSHPGFVASRCLLQIFSYRCATSMSDLVPPMERFWAWNQTFCFLVHTLLVCRDIEQGAIIQTALFHVLIFLVGPKLLAGWCVFPSILQSRLS